MTMYIYIYISLSFYCLLISVTNVLMKLNISMVAATKWISSVSVAKKAFVCTLCFIQHPVFHFRTHTLAVYMVCEDSQFLWCDTVSLSQCFLTFWSHYMPSKHQETLTQGRSKTSQVTWILNKTAVDCRANCKTCKLVIWLLSKILIYLE